MGKRKLSLSNEYFSHPNKLLFEHLKNVGDNSKFLVERKRLNLNKFISADILPNIAYLIGVAHDFGKSTSFFQDYLFEKDEKQKQSLKNKKETHHSFISAAFGYLLIQSYLENKNLLDSVNNDYLPLIGFIVIRRHHGDLKDVLNDVIIEDDDIEIFNKQLSTIDFTVVQEIYDKLLKKINLTFELNSLPATIKNFERITFQNKRKIRNLDEKGTLFFYFLMVFLYSILLDSDKTDAAELLKFNTRHLSPKLVDIYKNKEFGKSNKGINLIREEIYQKVTCKVSKLNLSKEKIFSLNVPTGSGKTLTSFSFALKLRNRIEKEIGFAPKIIYSLPFLSIIEQNYNTVKNVLNNPTTDILLKHHHLSDVYYETKENDFHGSGEDVSKNLLLIEGWNSEVIFTTFVQFFYSVITNKNKAARKFHNIVNSIVILDEVQAIPNKFWLLLNKTISFMAEYLNTYFVIMTATQPLIFDNPKELVENKEKYFRFLNRFNFNVQSREKSIEDFISYLKNEIKKFSTKDFLIILNTIKSSLNVYKELKKSISDGTIVFYLSTNIIPKERIERIKRIQGKNPKRKIIVSTQMVEAGVDIDVDFVIRDFAPLDSVNQAAGRCNRNFSEEMGTVRLFNLFEKNKETERAYFPKKIYDSFLVSKAEDVLKNIFEVEEKDFLKLTNDYFLKVKEGMSNELSRKILNNVERLKFDKLSEFKLIEKDYPAIDIFITVDKKEEGKGSEEKSAEEIWDEYQAILDDENLTGLEKRNAFLKIRKEFNDYIISVPEKYAVGFEKDKINYVSNEELSSYYDLETGFKRDNAGSGVLGI